ncbi:MAG: HTH domain-containing protein, partial [Prevotella sp.]|nr:HTH domain-containing protein [Prevotella sp.]
SKSSERMFGSGEKSSERISKDIEQKQKKVGKTAQKIIDLVISDPTISAEAMAYKIGISQRAVEKQIANLREMEILTRKGAKLGGYWYINTKP